jgi:hypothetical protein
LSDLEKQLGDNVGGFSQLKIIDIDNIDTIPDHVDYEITDDIILDTDWFNISFTPKTLKLSPGEIDNEKGTGFKPIITFFHAKDNAVSLYWLELYKQKNIIIKLKDTNNNYIIVGSSETPLKLKYKFVKNNNYSSRPGYQVTIYGYSLLPALYFTGDTVIGSGIAPTKLTNPTISGNNYTGETLTRVLGTYSGTPSPTVTGIWQRDGVDISGETSATYTVVDEDFGTNIGWEDNATNASGTLNTSSNTIKIINKYSLQLNGISKAINIDNVLTALSSTTVGTISFWIKPVNSTPTGYENAIFFGDTNADTDLLLNIYATTGVLQIRCRETGTNYWSLRTDSAPFSSGVWAHVALVQDGVTPIVYINGVAVAQTFHHTADKTKWFNDISGLDNGRIGCANVNNLGDIAFLDGNIDEVLFVNRALTALEVSDIYNSGAPKNEVAILNGVSMFRFDGDTVPTCSDAIGSNNGTYISGVSGDLVVDTP